MSKTITVEIKHRHTGAVLYAAEIPADPPEHLQTRSALQAATTADANLAAAYPQPNGWHIEPNRSGFRVVSAVPCDGCHLPLTVAELDVGRYCDACCQRAQDRMDQLRADDGECAGDLIL